MNDELAKFGRTLAENRMPVVGRGGTLSGNDCSHIWVANGGRGGKPDYRRNSQMWFGVKMSVACSECGGRTWLSPEEWEALPSSASEGA